MRSWIVFSRTEVWCIKAAWEEATLPPLAPSEINIAGTSENHLIPLPSWHRWQIPDSACLFKNNFYLMITAPQGCTAPYWNTLQICSQQLSANAANIIRVFFCPLLYHQKNAKSRSDNFFSSFIVNAIISPRSFPTAGENELIWNHRLFVFFYGLWPLRTPAVLRWAVRGGTLPTERRTAAECQGIAKLCRQVLSQGGMLCKCSSHASYSAFLAADHMKFPFRCWRDKKKNYIYENHLIIYNANLGRKVSKLS